MATKRDYYEILGLERSCNGDDVKRAYRKLAMKYHPDRNPGDADCEVKFKEASEAYEVISDGEKRSRYDRFGHEGLRGVSGHDFTHMDVGDIFSMFEDIFGGRGGTRRARGGPRRGFDLETQIELTLEEVYKSVEKEIDFTRQDNCESCHGSGAKAGSSPVACVTCGGSGKITQSGFGGMFRMVTACPACGGGGTVVRDKCPTCAGAGRQSKRRVLKVRVPAGIHDGQAVRVAGEGEPGAGGGPRGDLHVVVRIAPHKLFTREEDHLVLRMPVSFTQAALGAELEVPTLNGSLTVTVKPGAQHGDVMQLKGHGLPNLRTGRKGDLAILVLVEIPKKLSDKQEKILRQFAETEDRKVMPESQGFWDRIKEHLAGK